MISLKEGSPTWPMFGAIHPRLGILLYEFVDMLRMNGVDHVTITSLMRRKEGDSGIHELGRAVDIRLDFDHELAFALVKAINEKHPYSNNRPEMRTAIIHATDAYGDNGTHIHLQVSDE